LGVQKWQVYIPPFLLGKRELLYNGDFRKKHVSPVAKIGIWHCAAVFFSQQIPKNCTDLDLSLLYILILSRYGKFARYKWFLMVDAAANVVGDGSKEEEGSKEVSRCRMKQTCTPMGADPK